MDYLPLWIHDFVASYGSVGLFILLALGIFGLPIPDETLLILSGYLISKGKLPPTLTMALAVIGGMCGITLSYLVGYYGGQPFLARYGKWFKLTTERLDKAHTWFARFGKWLLLIGYYIPGVRHFTGLIAGSVSLRYWQFACFAYAGAAIWAVVFLSLGYYLPGMILPFL